MTMRQLSLPDCGSAMLVLAEPLTLDGIGQLECGFHNLLSRLRRELRPDEPTPGDLEFESWTPNKYLTNPIPRSHDHATLLL
jgi:hypothetical protein